MTPSTGRAAAIRQTPSIPLPFQQALVQSLLPPRGVRAIFEAGDRLQGAAGGLVDRVILCTHMQVHQRFDCRPVPQPAQGGACRAYNLVLLVFQQGNEPGRAFQRWPAPQRTSGESADRSLRLEPSSRAETQDAGASPASEPGNAQTGRGPIRSLDPACPYGFRAGPKYPPLRRSPDCATYADDVQVGQPDVPSAGGLAGLGGRFFSWLRGGCDERPSRSQEHNSHTRQTSVHSHSLG